MALNFPDNPTIGYVYVDSTSNFSYEWDGTVWKSYTGASSSNIKILDDISGSFNGITTSFTLTSSGNLVYPPTPQSLIINVGGVIQDPSDDYSVSDSSISFSTAPEPGLSFSGILLGSAIPIAYANDGNLYIRKNYTGAGTTGPFDIVEGYTPGNLDVYRNGVRLVYETDFVGTSGTNFFLSEVATVNDEIEAVAYQITSLVQSSSNLDNLNVIGITTTGRLNVSTNAVVSGILTATGGFVGSLTGTSSLSQGLTGNPNITVNNITGTAATFSGNVTIGGTLTYEDVTNIDSIGLVTARSGIRITSGGLNVVGVTTSTGGFVGNLTGTASTAGVATYASTAGVSTSSQGLTGTPNISVGTVNSSKIDLSGQYVQSINAVGALDINCSTGNYFTKTISSNSIFTFSNVPSSRAYSFTLELTHTSGSVTWPSEVKWPTDSTPTLTTGKTHLFVFVTDDGGSRWRGGALVDYVN